MACAYIIALLDVINWTRLTDPGAWEREALLAVVILAYLLYRLIYEYWSQSKAESTAKREARIERHEDHVEDLKEQLKRCQQKNQKLQQRLIDYDDRLQRITEKVLEVTDES